MKSIKMLSMVAIAALTAMAFVGASSAMASSTALCEVAGEGAEEACPEGRVFPTETILEASLVPGAESVLLGPNLVVEVKCKKSTSVGKTTNELAAEVTGELTSLAFSECTHKTGIGCTVTVNHLGTLKLLKTAANLGEAKVSEVLVTVVCGTIFKCVYTTESMPMHAVGTSGATSPRLTANEAPLKLEGIGVACPEKGFFDAKYEVTKPAEGFITS